MREGEPMFKYLKQYRFYIIFFAFIMIPVLSMDTATRAPREYRLHDRAVVALMAPVQAIISWTIDGIARFAHRYLFLLQTQRDNTSLLEENRRLLSTIINLREAKNENDRLRKILSFREEFKLDGIVARVIAKDVSTEFRSIRLNRGENDGVRKNMAVLNSEGVIGRVLRTTAQTADVVTILDILSAVDVVDKRTRARGIIEGMTDESCRLKYVLRTDDIQVGDLLLTSGVGGIFPKGVPIGNVSKVFRLPFGISQIVEVRPAVDISKLEEVFVVSTENPPPIHLTTHAALGDE